MPKSEKAISGTLPKALESRDTKRRATNVNHAPQSISPCK
jgi:hypothetical protein